MNKYFNRNILDWDEFPRHDVLWTDPPWQEGMVKFFITQCRKDTGQLNNFSLSEILNHLGTKANKNKPLVIEYSVKGHEYVVEVMESHGHVFKKLMIMPQVNGKPFAIMMFNRSYDIPNSLRGFQMIKHVIKTQMRSPVIFDPFAGIGQSANAVISAGGKYVGSELNPKRFSKLKGVVDKWNAKHFNK